MTLSRRRFGTAVMSTALAAAYGRIGWAQSPLVIKFSHVVTAEAPKGKGSLKFKQLAEQYTAGKVQVDVYHNSTLYKDKEEIEALQLGAVQMLAPSTAKFTPMGAKDFEALDLPYLFADDDQFARVVKGEIGKKLFDSLKPSGITGLAYWDHGFNLLTGNKPFLRPDDMQGVKIRISGSKVADNYFRKIGAIPQILAFSEVYQALQTGVVDAGENTAANILTQKFHEVQKHITVAGHSHQNYAIIVNSKFWDGIPADLRAGLDKAMAEATDYMNSVARQDNASALEAIKQTGKTTIHVLDEAQRKVWREALQPTYKWAEGRIGKDTMDMLLKATAS
jgi:C4-dicarboxylate-binding protein DctP